MKTRLLLINGIILIFILIRTGEMNAQSPQSFSYQAVIRNADGRLMAGQELGILISILHLEMNGRTVYSEYHQVVSTENGLVTLEIGGGRPEYGRFTDIPWGEGPFFIKTEIDFERDGIYQMSIINQLLSVPYALHALTAERLANGLTESDPLFHASPAASIDTEDITNWDESYSWGDHSEAGYLTEETDPSVPIGTQIGEMLYWNGSAWINVAPGATGQVLTFINGAPAWGPYLGMSDVQNPSTGKIWMDRNLWASQTATSSADANSFGHYYQWGRAGDGHQIRTSGTTTTLSSSDTPGHSNFIVVSDSPNDWRSPQNDNLWQGLNGTNNPCPSGYRLPTEAEWDAERDSWIYLGAYGAIDSPLKLPLAGYRHYSSGSITNEGSFGMYWSSTVNGTSSRAVVIASQTSIRATRNRAYGYSVRCIKN